MAKIKIKNNIFFRLVRGVLYTSCFLLFLFISVIVIINLPPVKEKIAKTGIDFLNKKFKTQISVKSVEVDLFGNLIFHEAAVKDHHNYDFIKADELKAYVNTASLLENLLIKRVNDFQINQLRLVDPVVKVITYKGENRDNFSIFVTKFKSKKPKSNKYYRLGGRLDLINGQLSIVNRNSPDGDQIWLDATELNLKVSTSEITNPEIKVTVEQLNFKGKRHKENYIVNQLSGIVYFSNTELSFKDLILESDTSLLFGSLSFTFAERNDMSKFKDKVTWNLDLKEGSKISGKDIRYFVKNWDSNSVINASSKVRGTLNNLTLINPILSVENTFYSGSDLLLKNLVTPNTAKSFSIETKKTHLQTSYASLKSWIPKFISNKIPEIISNFGTTNYTGDFSIDANRILVNGNMISSVGNVRADAKLTDYSSPKIQYEGWIETDHLNLAPFTKSSAIGSVTSKIHLNGTGLSWDYLDTRFDAQLTDMEINGKSISYITSAGVLNNKIFKGEIYTNDENADFNLEGNIDFSKKTIQTNFKADIKNLNVGYFIPVINKNTLFKGIVKTDIQFSSIDDLAGQINVDSITLTKEGKPADYNDILIKTDFENENRNLDIFSPNMITANIYGKYKLTDIPIMLEEGIGNLLVNYKPKKKFDHQEFSFILDVQKNLFDLLMLDVNLSPGTTITGRYIGEGNQLQAQIISEYIYYKNLKLSNPNIFLNTADSLRQFMGSLSSLNINNTRIDNINFSGFKKNDSLFASTNFYFGKDKESQINFDLNAYQTRIENDLIFGFKPSEIDLIPEKWTLNPDFNPDEAIAKYNVITNKLTVEKIELRSEESEIMVSGEYTSKDDYNFDLNFTEVKLKKLLPKNFLKNMSFEGLANGTAKIHKDSQEFKPLVNIDIEGLKFNHQSLGDLFMDAQYDVEEDKYLIDTRLIESGEERFLAQGYIKNEPGKPTQLNVDLTADKMNIAPIGSFLQNVFSKFRGNATGNVQITGDLTNPKYQGLVTMSQVGFTVNFLGVDYQLTKDQDLQISDGVFFFDNIELKDTEKKTKGTVFGPLITKNFSEWGMNLDFSTDKLLVLNTGMKENDMFFGTVYAAGAFSITGSTASGIEISATATALEGSSLTINSNSTTNATDISFIKFLPEKPKEEEGEDVKPPVGLSIRADVTADNRSVVNLIINQETKDRIEVRGETKHLKFNMYKSGIITMDGTYTITGESKYYYNMFVNKNFTIAPGSTIRWENRGPSEPYLNNIRATYTKLVSNIGDYLGISTVPATDVTVTALLTGYLSKPGIVFDIEADASSSIRDQLNTKLNNNEGEKYNQVVGIVVFGSFLSDKMGGSSYTSSVYDIVLKQLTSVINNISGSFSLDANFNAGSKVDNTSDRISLGPTVQLNRRLSIVGSVNMPLEQKSAADVWTYGGKLDYDISKSSDKSLIMSAFSKPSTFGLETSLLANSGANNQAYGGGILYKKSFNSLSDLFRKKKKEKTDSISVKKNN
ncbi:MAG: translocation/assembly module TamB [Flavobacteriaceae bacterium]|jgi:hypothetical protein|nr:translocation/assembly module TamB [Flavobacteriaceae bacterium]